MRSEFCQTAISSTVVHFMFGKKFFEDVIPWRPNKSLEPFSGGQEFP